MTELERLQQAVREFQAGSARDVLTDVLNGIDSPGMRDMAHEALTELNRLWDMVPVSRDNHGEAQDG